MSTTTKTLLVTSPVFEWNGNIPDKYSFGEDNINPPVDIAQLPEGTISMAIIMEDPDTGHGVFDHWVVWNIDPQPSIPENFTGGMKGMNGRRTTGYTGPNPPHGSHRYFIKIYAIDKLLELREGADKKMLLHVMKNHILAGGEIMGKYKNKVSSL